MTHDLPPLPNAPHRFAVSVTQLGERMDYTAKDMRDYALAAIAPYKAEVERLRGLLNRVAGILRGAEDEDQGEAYDHAQRVIDAALGEKP